MARSRRSPLRVIIGAPHVPSKWSRPASARADAGNGKGDPTECFGYLLPVSTADLENEAGTEIAARQTC